MPTQQLIMQFLDSLAAGQSASPQTIKNYRFYLNRFAALTGVAEVQQITPERIAVFNQALANTRNNRGGLMEPVTQNYHRIALRAFLKYLQTRGIAVVSADQVPLAQTPHRSPKTLDRAALERLLEAPLQTKETGIIQKRDKAILELLCSTGLKVSELAQLRRNQMHTFRDEFTIKGTDGTLRTIPLTHQTRYWLKSYLDLRTDSLPALFVRHDKAKRLQPDSEETRLTPRTIQRIIKKYAKSSDLPADITPQTLRHSYATHLLTEGQELETVKTMLGHRSSTMTQRYQKLAAQR